MGHFSAGGSGGGGGGGGKGGRGGGGGALKNGQVEVIVLGE